MRTTSPPPDDTRTVVIDLLYTQVSTCARCQRSNENLDTALGTVRDVLQAAGADVEVRRTLVRTANQARELRFEISPTIRVNGRDIVVEQRQSACGDACDCTGDASCRMWIYRGQEYAEAPVFLIVDSILTELYAATPRSDEVAAPHELPTTLAGGGCCA